MRGIVDLNSVVGPHPSADSEGKFIRIVIASQQPSNRKKRAFKHLETERKKQQLIRVGAAGFISS